MFIQFRLFGIRQCRSAPKACRTFSDWGDNNNSSKNKGFGGGLGMEWNVVMEKDSNEGDILTNEARESAAAVLRYYKRHTADSMQHHTCYK